MEKFGIPVALGLALSENPLAMQVFANLNEEKKKTVIDGTRYVKSKEEMQKYVNGIITEYK